MRDSYVMPHMPESFKDHKLTEFESHPVKMFELRRKENSWIYAVRLLFTPPPEQIIITGDVDNYVSNLKYGLHWFTGRLSEDYLCEKFLRKQYVPEYAKESLQYQIEELQREFRELTPEEDVEGSCSRKISVQIEELQEGIRLEAYGSQHAFYELWVDVFDDSPSGAGWGYDPAKAGWLCLIQQKFRELYMASSPRPPAEGTIPA